VSVIVETAQLNSTSMGGIRSLQVCARCRNHGVHSVLKGHKRNCSFVQCLCEKCTVTKDRQSFIAKEIAMHRYEIKNKSQLDFNNNSLKMNFVRSKSMVEMPSEVNEFFTPVKQITRKSNGEIRQNQKCSRCRNHNVVQLLRGHKNACPFAECECEKCLITMKRREIMAKQIKDYRNVKLPGESTSSDSSPDIESPEINSDYERLSIEPFVGYQPLENRDLFFMIQSLFEKYGNKSADKKIQLIYAFVNLAQGNWDQMEQALEKGKNRKARNGFLAKASL
jgi:hypothetical protein